MKSEQKNEQDSEKAVGARRHRREDSSRSSGVKFDAKTIVALTGLASVLLGGAEMRMAVSRLEDKVARIEERVSRIERELTPNPYARVAE